MTVFSNPVEVLELENVHQLILRSNTEHSSLYEWSSSVWAEPAWAYSAYSVSAGLYHVQYIMYCTTLNVHCSQDIQILQYYLANVDWFEIEWAPV